MWLSHSERPLLAHELCHAMGVEIGSTDLDPQNIPAIETLLGCCLGLVKIEAPLHTVRLAHYTLQEYLSNNTDLFHSPHSTIAQVCLTYLNFQCIRDLSPMKKLSAILYWFPPAAPLLGYASCYWGTHARREMTESVNTFVMGLLDGFDKHVSSGILLSPYHESWDWGVYWSNTTGFTGLHATAYFGMVETAVALLETKKWDLNGVDVAGKTAILWAARNGHGALVKKLLEREDVTPGTADRCGRTPLSWAAEGGHRDIVEMLLERIDVTPDTVDKHGRTPLSWAAQFGKASVVKIFLKRGDVAADTAD